MRAGCAVFLVMLVCPLAHLTAALHVEVVRGNGNNNLYGRVGQSILLHISDDAGNPVKGAAVIFSSADVGSSVDFGGDTRTAQTETDERGVAGAPSVRPVGGNGPVEVEVLVAKDGETANVVVHQMNLGFAAEASPEDLDVSKLPGPNRDIHANRIVRLSVTGVAGKPVAGAKVLLSMPSRKVGKSETLSTESRADGTADFSLDAKKFRSVTRVMVQAVAGGLSATRFIPLE
jgi:hypothetical protein